MPKVFIHISEVIRWFDVTDSLIDKEMNLIHQKKKKCKYDFQLVHAYHSLFWRLKYLTCSTLIYALKDFLILNQVIFQYSFEDKYQVKLTQIKITKKNLILILKSRSKTTWNVDKE